MLVAILAILPLFVIFNMIHINFTIGFSVTLIEGGIVLIPSFLLFITTNFQVNGHFDSDFV